MNDGYVGLMMMLMLAGGASGVFLLLAERLGPKRPSRVKAIPYECGMTPFENPQHRQAVKIYRTGMLFVVFDIELIFLFPWAVVFRETGWTGFAAIVGFLLVFELGFIYAWRKGAFQWT